MLQDLKARARLLKAETHALYLAAVDRRTPWYAKALVVLIVAYALSPIDLIPDFVPVLGYLDDVILIPAGIALAIKLIPADVLAEARLAARERQLSGGVRTFGAIMIITLWILAIILVIGLVRRWLAARA